MGMGEETKSLLGAKASRILQEISECREDERNSQERQLQLISIAATVLGVLLTATIWGVKGKDNTPLKDYLWALSLLSDLLFIASFSFISYLGIGNFLRYHYLKDLEKQYTEITEDSSIFIDWTRLSAPIKTINVKHINHPLSFMSFFDYIGGAFFALLFCLTITFVIYNQAVENSNNKTIVTSGFCCFNISFGGFRNSSCGCNKSGESVLHFCSKSE